MLHLIPKKPRPARVVGRPCGSCVFAYMQASIYTGVNGEAFL